MPKSATATNRTETWMDWEEALGLYRDPYELIPIGWNQRRTREEEPRGFLARVVSDLYAAISFYGPDGFPEPWADFVVLRAKERANHDFASYRDALEALRSEPGISCEIAHVDQVVDGRDSADTTAQHKRYAKECKRLAKVGRRGWPWNSYRCNAQLAVPS